MPTYSYLCENCGNIFEHFQGIKSQPLRKCKKCGQNTLKRLIGAGSAVIFKGWFPGESLKNKKNE